MKPHNHFDLAASPPVLASAQSADEAGTIDIQRLLAWYYATENNPPRHDLSSLDDHEAA